jgi:hypothetical protein
MLTPAAKAIIIVRRIEILLENFQQENASAVRMVPRRR